MVKPVSLENISSGPTSREFVNESLFVPKKVKSQVKCTTNSNLFIKTGSGKVLHREFPLLPVGLASVRLPGTTCYSEPNIPHSIEVSEETFNAATENIDRESNVDFRRSNVNMVDKAQNNSYFPQEHSCELAHVNNKENPGNYLESYAHCENDDETFLKPVIGTHDIKKESREKHDVHSDFGDCNFKRTNKLGSTRLNFNKRARKTEFICAGNYLKNNDQNCPERNKNEVTQNAITCMCSKTESLKTVKTIPKINTEKKQSDLSKQRSNDNKMVPNRKPRRFKRFLQFIGVLSISESASDFSESDIDTDDESKDEAFESDSDLEAEPIKEQREGYRRFFDSTKSRSTCTSDSLSD